MSRLNLIAFGVWLLSVLLLYLCSWPAYESMIPTDRKVVSISEDGRYLATVMSPAKLVRKFSGGVEYKGDDAPRGPIEIWDARSGAVLHSIECGTDIVQTVHVMDSGNLVVVSFRDRDSTSRLFSAVYRWKDDATQPSVRQIPGRIESCRSDVDGAAIAVVRQDASNASVTDLLSGKDLLRFRSSWHWKVLVHPDGTRVATIENPTEDGYTIRVLDTKTGDSVGSFLESDYPKAWTLSGDGKTLWIAVVNAAKQQASLHGWDIGSCQRHTSITPPEKSRPHQILMSAYSLKSLTPPFLQLAASSPKFSNNLMRVNKESIDMVDEDVNFVDGDKLLYVVTGRDSAGQSMLIARRIDDRREVFGLPGSGVLNGRSSDLRYVATRFSQANGYGLSTFRTWFSARLHTPTQPARHIGREICAVDLQDGSSRVVGVLPQCRFQYFEREGFIDGGKRILVNNYIWKFPGHRPWSVILLVPTLLVAILYWTAKRWMLKGAQPDG